MKVIVVGCGRVGIELATSVAERGINVSIIDRDQDAFQRLPRGFVGETVQGDVMDLAVLQRAGIEAADGFAAATSSDETNLVAARIARDLFHIPNVVTRVYSPSHASIFARAGIQTVVSSSWSANRIEQLLRHPGLIEVASAGHGEVRFLEVKIPDHLAGRPVAALVEKDACQPVTLVRGGEAVLAALDTPMEAADLVVLAVQPRHLPILQALLAGKAV
ncbi:MAG TPA: TrkA family potassium uptake protein [Anaerolineales bacterium]|nr:TrkA family potassium uptake protein [Anaerolineales bacterium]